MRTRRQNQTALAIEETGQRQRIEDAITGQDIHDALNVFRNGMKATRRVRIATGPQGTQYEDTADHTIRLASARLLIEFRHGKSVARSEVDISSTNSTKRLTAADITERLAGEGEQMLSIMQTYVQAAKDANSGNMKKAGPVTDVATVRDLT